MASLTKKRPESWRENPKSGTAPVARTYPEIPPPSATPVVLVVPPVLNPLFPTLGAAVLAEACRGKGIGVRIQYANITFAARVGVSLSLRLASGRPYTMPGESIFWGAAFPERAADHARILAALSRLEEPTALIRTPPPLDLSELLACAAQIPDFVADTADTILASSPLVVGFSSMCQQTLASIALAGEIKRRRPDILTILGGVNAAEPMGSALLDLTNVFDFVFSGEADVAFPAFCRAWLDNRALPSRRVVSCAPITNLDDVPIPDYGDYYEQLEPLRTMDPLAADAPARLIFESSRGCWWGDKHNCTFCGLGALGGRYRAKSPDRVVHEIEVLRHRHGNRELFAADTIMAQDFPSRVLPRLAEHGAECALSYVVKSNIRETDLDAFARAGVLEIQPGIESFSTHVLRLVSKGVTALENVRLLRDALSRGIDVVWNFLSCIPGEEPEDYERMLVLFPLLHHLRPPIRWGPIRLSRNSPYHQDPGRYGISSLRPWTVYRELYGDHAEKLARHFDGHYETGLTRDPELYARLRAGLRAWADAWIADDGPPDLSIHRLEDGRVVAHDSRAAAQATYHVLSDDLMAALDLVRLPRPVTGIPKAQEAPLRKLVSVGLVAEHEGELLALPTDPHVAEAIRSRPEGPMEAAGWVSH